MKKITLKIVFFLVLVVSIDIALGHLLEYLYFKQKKGKSSRITKVLENVKSDILIFGSSRAVQHYDPFIIEKMTGLSTFNVGLDGQSIIYQKAILEVILTRHQPKLIVLELFEGMDFSSGTNQYDRLSVLLPYVKKYSSINNIVLQRSRFEKVKLLSKTYPYNSLLIRIIEGNIELTNTDKSNTGFVPKSGHWNLPIKEITKTQPNYDEAKVQYFYDFVNICKQKNISLFVIISPKFEKCEDCFSFSQEICDFAKIQLHNYSSDNIFVSNIKYFENPSHLNSEGAKVYSEFISLKLIDWLKLGINNKN
jgi:hypothetical protein